MTNGFTVKLIRCTVAASWIQQCSLFNGEKMGVHNILYSQLTLGGSQMNPPKHTHSFSSEQFRLINRFDKDININTQSI